jgi:hypothetical protein
MQTNPARLATASLFPAILVVFASFAFLPIAHAQSAMVGKYECAQIEAEGRTAHCQSPPLILNRDGSYQIWGEHGTFEVVQGRWLVLSHSKRRGLGHVKNSQEIVFEYRIDGRPCRVTFRLIVPPRPGFYLG